MVNSPKKNCGKVPKPRCKVYKVHTVQFRPDVKRHDGMKRNTWIFYLFICYVLGVMRENIVLTLVSKRNVLGLKRLLDNLEDLIKRCENSQTGSAPISHRGGRDSGSITKAHLHFLREEVLPYLKKVLETVRKENPSQKEDYLNAKKRKCQETQVPRNASKELQSEATRKFLSDEKT